MFHDLEVDGEKIPEGQSVKIIRVQTSWWDQPADVEAYLIALLLIVMAVATAFAVA